MRHLPKTLKLRRRVSRRREMDWVFKEERALKVNKLLDKGPPISLMSVIQLDKALSSFTAYRRSVLETLRHNRMRLTKKARKEGKKRSPNEAILKLSLTELDKIISKTKYYLKVRKANEN